MSWHCFLAQCHTTFKNQSNNLFQVGINIVNHYKGYTNFYCKGYNNFSSIPFPHDSGPVLYNTWEYYLTHKEASLAASRLSKAFHRSIKDHLESCGVGHF